ncbi:MAG: hypothetical protein ACI3ZB_08535 [Prevotella sp.]
MKQQDYHTTDQRYKKFITGLEDGVAEYDRLMRAGKAPGQRVRARMHAIAYATAAACIIGFTMVFCLMQPAASDESAGSVIAMTSNNKDDVEPLAEKTSDNKAEAKSQDRSNNLSDKALAQEQTHHNHTKERCGSSRKAHMLPEIVIADTPDMLSVLATEKQQREDTFAVQAYQLPDVDCDGNNQWAENTKGKPVEVFVYSQPYGKDV